MGLHGACRIPVEDQGAVQRAGSGDQNLDGKLDAMVAEVKPVLDYVDMEVAP